MFKRILAILLSLLLLPSLAAAAEIDFSDYSQKELERLLQDAAEQLLEIGADAEPNLLWENENASIHYSSFQENGDDDYVYLDVLLTNKTDETCSFGFFHASLNQFSVSTSRLGKLDVYPQSSRTVSIPIPRDEFEQYPIRFLESVAVYFSYTPADDPSLNEEFASNTCIIQ